MLIDIVNTTKYNRHIASIQEIQIARFNRQWTKNSPVTATKDDLEDNTAIFLFGVIGTGVTIESNGKTIVSGVDNPNFQNSPLALSTNGFAITGNINLIYGFYL